MSKEDSEMKKTSSCSCPFCDEPICPDPADGTYTCKNDGNLTIHRVDCIGLYCPVPVMRAKEEIDQLEEGNLMELIANDPAAMEDIPRWARRAGHLLVTMRQKGESYHFFVQKGKGEISQHD
ncbi:MAG: sulfurtransferase TusA family protein [Clostridia bacterium]|nr:sulfurtransferase TusA family protein [Clostridia bacterium]